MPRRKPRRRWRVVLVIEATSREDAVNAFNAFHLGSVMWGPDLYRALRRVFVVDGQLKGPYTRAEKVPL